MELDKTPKIKPDSEFSVKQRKKKQQEFKYEGNMSPKKGHTMYEINTKTEAVKEAEFIQRDTIHWFDALRLIQTGFKQEIQVNKGCVYISALNADNALKRWKQNKGSAIQPSGGKITFW